MSLEVKNCRTFSHSSLCVNPTDGSTSQDDTNYVQVPLLAPLTDSAGFYLQTKLKQELNVDIKIQLRSLCCSNRFDDNKTFDTDALKQDRNAPIFAH